MFTNIPGWICFIICILSLNLKHTSIIASSTGLCIFLYKWLFIHPAMSFSRTEYVCCCFFPPATFLMPDTMEPNKLSMYKSKNESRSPYFSWGRQAIHTKINLSLTYSYIYLIPFSLCQMLYVARRIQGWVAQGAWPRGAHLHGEAGIWRRYLRC